MSIIDENQAKRKMLHFAAILAAVSLIMVCFALTKISNLAGKIVVIGGGALLFAFSAILIFLLILTQRPIKKGEHNFFLYDRKARANIPPENLTADIVSERLTMYMALFQEKKRLYLSTLFEEEGGAPEVFKPLFCYQLLGMLSAGDGDEQLSAFLSCGKELADTFSTYLSIAGEEELCRDVQIFIARYDGKNVAPFRDYLRQKSGYLADRMLAYTKEHIHEFD